MDFSFWGFMKDNVYISQMVEDLQELCDRIVNAIALVDATFLNKLWGKLEYTIFC
jgi:putative N-acetylmannosamine-6-phosphate epimerase